MAEVAEVRDQMLLLAAEVVDFLAAFWAAAAEVVTEHGMADNPAVAAQVDTRVQVRILVPVVV
jgi:hypothetical protein